MMTALIAEIFAGENDAADIVFLIGVIAAVISAIGRFGTNQVTKHSGWLLCAAVACIAFGLLLL